MLARRLIPVAFVALLLNACGGGLSDAEQAWCPDHAQAVAAAADDLGLPPPSTGDGSWQHWAELVDSGLLKDLWNSMTVVDDRPNRDRACKAAFAAR